MRKLTICIDNASPLRGLALYQCSIRNGLQGTLYDPLECWETIVKFLKIQTSTLAKFGLMSAFFGLYGLGGRIPSIA